MLLNCTEHYLIQVLPEVKLISLEIDCVINEVVKIISLKISYVIMEAIDYITAENLNSAVG